MKAKKFWSVLLAASLTAGALAGCGGSTSGSKETASEMKAQVQKGLESPEQQAKKRKQILQPQENRHQENSHLMGSHPVKR